MEDKKPFYYKTSFWVFFYAGVLALAMSLQVFFAACAKFELLKDHIFIVPYLNGSFTMPLSVMAWIWVAICSAYIGIDRASYTVKTMCELAGQMDVGNPDTLRLIIAVSGVLFAWATAANMVVDADFALDAYATGFGTSIAMYIAGMKAIKSVKYVNGSIDQNNDGIPDEEEEEYEKWVRRERKNGVESQFINYLYFKDWKDEQEKSE